VAGFRRVGGVAISRATSRRALRASTGTNDPRYSDVLNVNELIGPEVINTTRKKTLRAFADHGEATRLVAGRAGRRRTAGAGLDRA
jgi:transaldolase